MDRGQDGAWQVSLGMLLADAPWHGSLNSSTQWHQLETVEKQELSSQE